MAIDLTQKSKEELRQLANSKEPGAASARTELGNRRKVEEKDNKKTSDRPKTPTGRK
jgi:hypothetical protein